MKATTLRDYDTAGVPEPGGFYESNRHLAPIDYRRLVSETYGPAASRSATVKCMVNEAVMLYLLSERGGR